MLIWAALSAELRSISRLIANEDCWTKTVFQKMAHHVGFPALYINCFKTLGHDSLKPLMDALTQRNSLILFPQARAATRNSRKRSSLACPTCRSGLLPLC